MFSTETQRQAAAFDMIGERYDDAFPHKSAQIIATQWVIDRLTPGARVLDVGSGTGVPTAGMLVESLEPGVHRRQVIHRHGAEVVCRQPLEPRREAVELPLLDDTSVRQRRLEPGRREGKRVERARAEYE